MNKSEFDEINKQKDKVLEFLELVYNSKFDTKVKVIVTNGVEYLLANPEVLSKPEAVQEIKRYLDAVKLDMKTAPFAETVFTKLIFDKLAIDIGFAVTMLTVLCEELDVGSPIAQNKNLN